MLKLLKEPFNHAIDVFLFFFCIDIDVFFLWIITEVLCGSFYEFNKKSLKFIKSLLLLLLIILFTLINKLKKCIFKKIYITIIIYLPVFLDTGLPRGNVHKRDSGPMWGTIPT